MNLYKKAKNITIYIPLVCISLLLVLCSYIGLFRIIPIFDIFNVTLGTFVTDIKTNVSTTFYKFEQTETLVKDNINLRKDLLQKDIEINKLQDSKAELESLKKLNNIKTTKPLMIQARSIEVVSSNKVPVDITINKGRVDGIVEGKIVINDTGTLIGKVSTVNQYTARIKPYYTEDIKLPLRTVSSQSFLVDGIKNGDLVIRNLDPNIAIAPNVLFFTSSIGDVTPDGIFIGKSKKIDPEDTKKVIMESDILNISILYVYI